MRLYQILVSLALGALAGWIASIITKSKRGVILNIVFGLVGGVVGGWIGSYFGIAGGWVTSLLLAVGGACLITWIGRLIFK